MGFIIWYQVVIQDPASGGGVVGAVAGALGLALPVKVSNDPFSGAFILDAEIQLAMKTGATASTFDIRMINLPADAADLIKQKHQDGLAKKNPLQAEIHLGYFDDPSTTTGSDPVMTGAIMRVHNVVGEDGLLQTRIQGQELGGYTLRNTPFSQDQASGGTIPGFLQKITDATNSQVTLASGPQLTGGLPSFTLRSQTALEALRQMAEAAQVPLVIRDQKIFIGPTVGQATDAASPFTPDDDIVRLDDRLENEEGFDPDQAQAADQLTSLPRTSLAMTVLGDPSLRVGQVATVTGVERAPQGTLRIQNLEHHFSTRSGYTCDLEVVLADAGALAKTTVGAAGLVDRWREVTEGLFDQKPSVDMGQVNAYSPGSDKKHLATLDYAQVPPSDAVAPSVAVPIQTGTQLHDKPIASPFAWHKCGLIVPVYPGMRSVLVHNRSLVNDAILSGFVWSENPLHERPKNEPGDYWLCLPTGLGSDQQPTGAGVNDLTDQNGFRIIQTKGLHIFVGSNKLPAVGTRPDPPTDQSIVIDHESGTSITIDSNGGVTIKTANQDLSLSNGSVSLKLSGSAVQVSS